jgi:hypothetical protein
MKYQVTSTYYGGFAVSLVLILVLLAISPSTPLRLGGWGISLVVDRGLWGMIEARKQLPSTRFQRGLGRQVSV